MPTYLTRNEQGHYEGEFHGARLLGSMTSGRIDPLGEHPTVRVPDTRFKLEFQGHKGGPENPAAYFRTAAYASIFLGWLDGMIEIPVSMRKRDGWFWWKGYPMVAQKNDGRTGASDWWMKGAPVLVYFNRLGNARAFMKAVVEAKNA